MPEKATLDRALEDRRDGKSPSTQAGEFVREEIDHIRQGVHGARSTKQAIAIGLSKARRAGIKIPARGKNKGGKAVQARAENRRAMRKPSQKRARATLKALRREGSEAASPSALSRFAKASARKRGAKRLRESARTAARTRSMEKENRK